MGNDDADPEVTRRIYSISDHLKRTLYDFTRRFEIDILIVQNALCIPMNIPFGVALTNFIAETGFPTIAHHHDFYWERDRFSVNAVGDLLGMAFPPALPSIQHVTINSFAQEDLSHRKGVSSVLVPNVLDFETEPEHIRTIMQVTFATTSVSARRHHVLAADARRAAQGHRAFHLAGRRPQGPKCKLVVSHESGDEGDEYLVALKEMAEQEGVDLRFTADRITETRTINESGTKTYTLADAYSPADFITYPSLYEGFGNALLEAFYFRKPVLVNRYSIFITDIEPKGFQVTSMNGYLTKNVIDQVRRVIQDSDYRHDMVDHNYELGKRFFSYSVLRRKLRALITNVTGMDDL